MTIRGGCWPTREQAQLLRATLLAGRDGARAWELWKQAVDLTQLDAGSVRLLPHLYRSLERQGVRDPLLSRFKKIYHQTWYANHVRLGDAAVVLERLRAGGIEPMLLKGAALILRYYRNAGLRPMEDVDILVRTQQAAAATDVLTGLGWAPSCRVTADHVRAGHAVEFTAAAGQRVDLHWHLLPESCWPGVDEGLWNRAGVSRLRGIEVHVLDPTDQLFHVCAHGLRWEPVPPLRWVADAAVVARSDVEIDWDRLVEETERHRAALPVRDALDYLRGTLGLPIPARTLERLRGIRVSMSEQWAYRLQTRPASWLLGRLPEHWLRYRRLQDGWKERSPIGFARYLQVVLGCDGRWDLFRRTLLRHRWRRQSQRLMSEYERRLNRAALP